ncbi:MULTISPECIES: carboxylating nicotinate-nucleotide diphosphorylase [Delftia]|jgi:nicotinate-nucleotide pyrophosphorylase (carboxylating)|uniref:Probable nicotinate-nucleotide pyrophosphorylase [carboxylating] n=2 Tax=Delftia TaxID=80865 RepID=A0AAX3SQJ2_9BURK|nr:MULTISPECIES: carboxylating nicotinate-nucleotide diphosphorylase [Delftia]PIF39572.1 nicotinate-nucleotide pyrophosphorylase [carboxylating] [Burkholderiales bacterium 23]AOV02857.1 nicotinate-nucleotide diphosphorylase (carboxylating) [Delftia tsuruhatensis]APE47754.1 nicotinate-nucleotide diphosphorylase (carboxylating) [Delftia sp. HK171]EPD39274.1 nicotinate-nucleotide diphosphorylase (carboxylating) [Delftia acidovorans CCUG 274B]EZP48593.1 Nicotinate-nucleotide diphosphorylase (Carbo
MSINIANALSARLPVPPLPDLMLEPLVRSALLEDLGRAGDLTTDAIVPADAQAELRLVARQEGVLAGLDMARLAFRALDAQSRFEPVLRDGSELAPGQEIARIHGSARAILTAERVALNYLCHLSGVATATASIARAIADTGARVTCTRKTMPGLRALQKYAVRVGGGSNHRFGLDDAVLIKDNHIALAGGVAEALARARAGVGHMVQIQLEVDTLEQLEVALSLGVEVVLLDNMDLDTLRTAVSMARGRAVTEASGRITPETARAVAETGVDQIAVGWITHSARVLDIGLDT